MDEQPKIAEPKPKPRRRWYQYSLRTLLIFVTLVGCGFGWLGSKVREARQQEAVLALIWNNGGSVFYDYQWDPQGKQLLPNATPPGPAWLHALLGDDCFRHVSGVFFDPYNNTTQSTVSDADLEQYKVLSRLEFLTIGGPEVTDRGLAHLSGMTQLKGLALIYTKVTDAGLESLKGLTRLEQLGLSYMIVTDAGLESLKGLTQLEALDLSKTKVTDKGLESLKGLTQLKFVNLDYTLVTDRGVAKLHNALPNCHLQNAKPR